MSRQLFFGHNGENLREPQKTQCPGVFDIPSGAPHRVRLAGRREPPEIGPEDRQLVGGHVFQVELPGVVAGEIQPVDIERRRALVDGARHAEFRPRRCGRKPADPAEKLQGTNRHPLLLFT